MQIFERSKPNIAAAYDAYADTLYRIALSQLQNSEDAEDAVQDVFTKYLTAAPRFHDGEHERSWLIRATVNRSRDILRSRKVRLSLPLEEAEGIAAPHTEEHGVLHRLSLVSDPCREAIVLHHLEGYSVEETAKLLRVSVSAVKMRLARGRKQLAEAEGKEEA